MDDCSVEAIPMDRPTQLELAQRLRALHRHPRPLLLPNAWDAGSARLLAALGFAAVATTSGGMAWSLGYADGERAPLDELLAAIARIVRVTAVPVSVDFEGGHAATAAGVGEHVRALIDTGAVGVNLEDGIGHTRLRDIDAAAARIAAAREAADACGVPLVINARVDVWIVGGAASDEERFEDGLRRARAYLAAGADCIYPIAVAQPALIGRLCAAIPAPVNIGARPGLPRLDELARLGVARVSTATRLATLALGAVHAAAQRLRHEGDFAALASAFDYEQAQRLFERD